MLFGQAVNWNEAPLSSCTGLKVEVKPEDFQAPLSESSDLHRYLLIYTQGWTVAYVIAISFFSYIKFSTKFDSAFFQPSGSHDNLLFKFFAPQIPFSDGLYV